jgi:hypothetical protein
VVGITGTRLYTHLPTGAQVLSAITGLYPQSYHAVDQRFYPYSLLASSPGVYSMNTAPILDVQGLAYSLSPGIPNNGQDPNSVTYTVDAQSVYMATSPDSALLSEGASINSPSFAFQQQNHELLAG